MSKQSGQAKTDLVYGVNPVVELIAAKKRRMVTLYTTEKMPAKIKSLISSKKLERTNLYTVTKERLTKIAGTSDHQGVVGLATPFIIRKKPFDIDKQKCVILLDGIQDPRNVGAILRSAYCAGFDAAIIPQRMSCPLNAVVLKSSAGLAEHIEIYQPPSQIYAVQELKKQGYNFYLGVLSDKSKDATIVDYKKSLCLVVGSEGFGVSKSILNCGVNIKIPQKLSDISYNASVAAGILMFLISSKAY